MATEKNIKKSVKTAKKTTAAKSVKAPKAEVSAKAPKVAKVETKKAAPKAAKSDLFAVIKISGVQIKVEEGKLYEVEKLPYAKGDTFDITDVLLVGSSDKVTVGKPLVSGAKVTLVVDSQKKGDKINGFKYKAKSRYHKRFGYRASISRVEVKKISA